MGRPSSFAQQAIFDVIEDFHPNNQTAMQSQRVISKSRSAVNEWPRSKDCFAAWSGQPRICADRLLLADKRPSRL